MLRSLLICTCVVAAAVASETTMTDNDIRDAVEGEILFDAMVPLDRMDVSVREGIVTLTGQAPHLLARERSTRIAGTVRGVRAVVDRLEIRTPAREDATIAKDVEDALLIDPAADSYEVGVRVEDGAVTLTGTVESWQEREIAGRLAMSVKGVKALENEIALQIEDSRLDGEILADVRQRLHWDTRVDDGLLEVAVANGAVTLRGIAGSVAEKRVAEWISWVAGVKAVDANGVEVKRWARDSDLRHQKYVARSDEEIEKAVGDAFLYDPRVLSFEIDVEAMAGTVTLRGTVDNAAARRAAELDARNTVGVVGVRNRIKVVPEAVADDTLADRIRSSLLRDSWVERLEIAVDVRDGRVTLRGDVDSYFEKLHAETIASRVTGVGDVVNALAVRPDARLFAFDPYVDPHLPFTYAAYTYVPLLPMISDSELQNAIRTELWWSPFVDAGSVKIQVENGIVTLSGTVDSLMERRAAFENALEGGATWVVNNLETR